MDKKEYGVIQILKGEPFTPGTNVFIRKNSFIIGRLGGGNKQSIVFTEPAVSRHHLTIQKKNNRYYVKDTNSKHGSMLNGTAMEKGKEYLLREGDRIALASGTALVAFTLVRDKSTDDIVGGSGFPYL